MLSIYVLITCVIVLIGKYCWSRRHFYYASWKLPGEMSFPLIGTAWILWNTTSDFFGFGAEIWITHFWLGPRFMICISKPEHVEVAINASKAMDRAGLYQYVEYMIGGAGLLTLEGDLWKMHRRLLNPTVQNTNILNSFYACFNDELKIMVENLNHECGRGTFDIYEYMEACSFGMSCKTTLGVDLDVQKQQNLLKTFTEALLIVGARIFQPWLQFEPLMRVTKYHEMKVRTTSELRSFIKEILQQRKLEISGEADLGDKGESGGKRLRIFIDECIRMSMEQKCFSEKEIISESLTMLFTGYETVAVTVSNIIVMLALHPEYQKMVSQEIRDIFPHNDSVVTSEDLKQLNFTDRVIKETMRLTPTVPIIAREAKENFNVGKYYVPIETELIISMYGVHRNKDIWGADAESFNPDHFLPENIKQIHPHSFLPFSADIRDCMGKKYANIVIRLFVVWLVTMVRNYVFSTDLKLEDLRYNWMIVMKLKGGYQVKMEKRQKY